MNRAQKINSGKAVWHSLKQHDGKKLKGVGPR